MAKRFKSCVRCHKIIADSEFHRGLFVESDRGLLCATCAQLMDEVPEAEPASRSQPEAKPNPTAQSVEDAPRPASAKSEEAARLLADIRQKLEVIHDGLMFEKTSSWNVLGGVAQVIAVGALVMAVFNWLDDPLNLLMVALIFQVLTLTFFVKGK